MNDIQIFNNAEFGEVRTVQDGEKVLFCGSDVAKALGYADTAKAIKSHCKPDGWAICPVIDSMNREQFAKFINEGNVYRLITHSKLPDAERFEAWVFDEVLPSIRNHGAYMTPEVIEQTICNPDYIIKLAHELKDWQEHAKHLTAKIESDKPKVLFADSVATADNTILVGELAKILKQNGVSIGQNRMFDWLRDNGYLISRKGSDRNMPTQKSMDLGLFEIKERVVNNPDGSVRTTKTPKITGKGQQYFINKFLS